VAADVVGLLRLFETKIERKTFEPSREEGRMDGVIA
jgi:hypothetical protein